LEKTINDICSARKDIKIVKKGILAEQEGNKPQVYKSVDGLVVTKDVFQAAIAFRESIVPSVPRPLEIVRVSISSVNEKPSMWEPSQWKIFRKFSQVMTQEMLELRMKQSESGPQQLVNLIDRIVTYNYQDTS